MAEPVRRGRRTASTYPELLQNARLLNAGEWTILRPIRLPYVLAWTLAVLPLGATFAIISVVTAEILSGTLGIGRLLATATQTADSTLTFALVVVLSVMGLVVLGVADFIKSRVLELLGRLNVHLGHPFAVRSPPTTECA